MWLGLVIGMAVGLGFCMLYFAYTYSQVLYLGLLLSVDVTGGGED